MSLLLKQDVNLFGGCVRDSLAFSLFAVTNESLELEM
jgi:hypothetical protein